MIITINSNATDSDLEAVDNLIRSEKLELRRVSGGEKICILSWNGPYDKDRLKNRLLIMSGVAEIKIIKETFILASIHGGPLEKNIGRDYM
jgi:hypothetical protein